MRRLVPAGLHSGTWRNGGFGGWGSKKEDVRRKKLKKESILVESLWQLSFSI